MSTEAEVDKEHRHRLAAIMFTDIVGYTAMSARNELDALRAVSEYEKLAAPIFERHKGNQVKSLGDGTLLEFDSALSAVNSAVELQTALQERNRRSADPIRLRIGIHVGEVIYRDGDVFGDGVNIAARVQAAAPPSGVCFTSDVWKLVQGKVPFQVVALGRSELKNVGRLIEVYRIRFPWDETSPARDKTAILLKRKGTRPTIAIAALAAVAMVGYALTRSAQHRAGPAFPSASETAKQESLVVLPFKNMSDDPKLEYWSDGLTEELIGALSTVPNMGVIGRETASTFKSKATDVREICHSLGVSAALEGSVRRETDRLRVSVRLTDGGSGLTLWSANYDEPTKDVFEVQQRIATAVASQFRQKLDPGQTERLTSRSTKNASAYEEYLKGQHELGNSNITALQEARSHFEAAIKIDSQYAPAYAALSDTYYHLSNIFMPPKEAMPKARDAANKAIELNPSLPEGYVTLGNVLAAYDWNWKAGELAYTRALALGAGSAQAHLRYANFLTYEGRFEQARRHFEVAMKLEPRSMEPRLSYSTLLHYQGNHDEEISVLQSLKHDFPDTDAVVGMLAFAYFSAGRRQEGIDGVEQSFKENRLFIPASNLVGMYMAVGRPKDAQRYLRILERREVLNNYVSPYAMGLAYAQVGRLDDAFKQWDIAFEERSEDMTGLAVEPMLNPFRSDPRFQSLLARMGLPKIKPS